MAYGSKAPYYAKKGKKPYKKKYYKSKSTALTVASKALALAKRNNKLAYGSYQIQLQHTERTFKLTNAQPCCFMMTTPFNTQPIYQFKFNTGSGQYEVNPVTNLAHPSLVQLTGGLGEQGRNYWRDCNDDKLNGKYKLLWTKLEIRLSARSEDQKKIPCRLRVDFVKPKWNRVMQQAESSTGTQRNLQLPASLGSFGRIMTDSNHINPMYWNRVGKPCFLNIHAGVNETNLDYVVKTCFFKQNMVINPKYQGSGYEAYENVPLNKQIWAVISTDIENLTPDDNLPDVSIKRIFAWRDGAGHAA